MNEKIFVYFIGTAGSGKSTLTKTFRDWMNLQGLDTVTVNLDPGAENIPYEPDIDVRDWISLEEVMESYELGPNGAQIACADMIALNANDIKESIDQFKTDYVLVDTPGQLELFVFREAGKHILQFLSPDTTMLAYLIDHSLAKTPSGFITQILLSVTTNFRLKKPQVNLLSKSDMLKKDEIEQVLRWAKDPYELEQALTKEETSMYQEINQKILRLIHELGGEIQLFTTGKNEIFQLEDFYTVIQMQFEGGEDRLKD